MCPDPKQILNAGFGILALLLSFSAQAIAAPQERSGGDFSQNVRLSGGAQNIGRTAGGVSVGEGNGGITDRAYITAPPNYLYVVEKGRGSFLDCGDGQEVRVTDEDGRDMAHLRCGVTLTETIIIPAAASSARIIIHY